MTNEPGIIADSLVEFGQQGEYNSHSMSEVKESMGFAPFETLPAEWYNNYLFKLDAHINRLQVLLRQVQTELTTLITAGEGTPSESALNQVVTAINQLIVKATPLATGSAKGMVVSDSGIKNVSVDTQGVMNVNALSDWEGNQTAQEKLDALAQGTSAALSTETAAREGVDVASVSTSLATNTLTTKVTSTDGTEHTATSSTVSSATLSRSGNNMTIKVNGVGASSVNPINTVACAISGTTLSVTVNGVKGSVALPSTSHAISATYLRPANSTSTLVYAEADGTLHGHILALS